MSKLTMPYQCLKQCGNLLIAARGSTIETFNLESRSLVSSWKCPSSKPLVSETSAQEEVTAVESPAPAEAAPEESVIPPVKRRKLSLSETPAEENKNWKHNNKGKNHRQAAASTGLDSPAVIALAVTSNGHHVIAVTSEDKSIRVFENSYINLKHELKQLSQRTMPKRPCGLAITDDSSTIISADKFGDVFSLPLVFQETPIPSKNETPVPATTEADSVLFTPAANHLTVHSVRNRKALENQKRQAKPKPDSSGPEFEHKLLLGHVSMLTDVALHTYNGRHYIFTADRDEHIRISRGIPQAHIIEQFCLGHTDFVSRLCIPSTRPEILISGGGDDELLVWDWENGNLLSRADLKGHVEVVCHEHGKAATDGSVDGLKIAVNQIEWIMVGGEDLVVVGYEAVPALFVFQLTAANTLQHIQRIQLAGNVLSFIVNSEGVVVSVDTVHALFSSSEQRNMAEAVDVQPLSTFVFEDQRLVPGPAFEGAEQRHEVPAEELGRLGALLYGLENLRKREGDGRDED
ncbi:guanine-N(7)--methyltransferase subunit trm82 [Calycina marina]|uniref:Guanine-N(7)--methyltransferase subunit trm82 n=1 Tax=Calycina marina TaxID=1763456 RepID=A0A9P7Z785_9HELO|nr:guanine-N(7)--methyltransferase subunit trm82 [Calycina marina]